MYTIILYADKSTTPEAFAAYLTDAMAQAPAYGLDSWREATWIAESPRHLSVTVECDLETFKQFAEDVIQVGQFHLYGWDYVREFKDTEIIFEAYDVKCHCTADLLIESVREEEGGD